MRKIFILGGSYLQLDLILEAKKMFFYTIVLDMDKECVGSRWCDEFLHIDIANKELVLQKAKEYEISVILTSATELGNLTACFVGEKLNLNTNSYQTALNTTNKILMKNIFIQSDIKTAKYLVYKANSNITWNKFPCIVKPADSSAGRGLSYCTTKEELSEAIKKAQSFSSSNEIIFEEYIEGTQYSVETISSNSKHQILAIDTESIHELPHIMEVSHNIPAIIDEDIQKNINHLAPKILRSFNIDYGACHIELKVKPNGEIYIIEIASRTGGMRSEMINLAYGINYSQLLLLSALNALPTIQRSKNSRVICNFIIDYDSYKEYKRIKDNSTFIIFEPFEIPNVSKDFRAEHIGQSKGYYFILNAHDI